jgi:hypothetical protein
MDYVRPIGNQHENIPMAIYHCSIKAISRSSGRTATASAAYRAAEKIHDLRTGELYDYSRKRGVIHAEIYLPEGGKADRADLWNRLEFHHKRGDAVLAREIEISLPAELTDAQRQNLVHVFARDLTDRYQVAADVAIHAPSRGGDDRNYHAHILLTACQCSCDGKLGRKVIELDPISCQRPQRQPDGSLKRIENAAEWIRPRWAELCNERLREAGIEVQVDYRSLSEQGIEREPTRHIGPTATAIERRTGELSRIRIKQSTVVIAEPESNIQENGLGNRLASLRQKMHLGSDQSTALRSASEHYRRSKNKESGEKKVTQRGALPESPK